jgi:hypothetical protein
MNEKQRTKVKTFDERLEVKMECIICGQNPKKIYSALCIVRKQ